MNLTTKIKFKNSKNKNREKIKSARKVKNLWGQSYPIAWVEGCFADVLSS
jgi:uncharacterized membrane protein